MVIISVKGSRSSSGVRIKVGVRLWSKKVVQVGQVRVRFKVRIRVKARLVRRRSGLR
jgi:hypothetical protein